ncbi:response regulator [Marinobacter sp. F3R08]|uniref:response regulator n=1 Tax=Marinobacter sp. F3R08 TaxID=2841559 RepID=UPI001C09DC73|nr:response regulator [Marinobacter sp. F3R08]MBU2954238.1 response regulator [Marinobacter sp. F3R08]
MAGVDMGAKYQVLKQQYVQGLPSRLEELRTSWNRLRHVSWSAKVLSFMEQSAHKLAGSGSTFQFPDISESARILEEQLQQLLDKPDPTPAERNRIEVSLGVLERAIELAINAGNPEEAAGALAEVEKKHYRIAIVDDDDSQVARLKEWLEARDYAVDTFDTPGAYNEKPDDHRYHLILLGMSFPGGVLAGVTLLERLKSRMDAASPVIMMSARSDMVARMRALRAGADFYLTKPLDLGVLEKRIEQLLSVDKGARQRILWVEDDSDQLAYYQTLLLDEGYEVEGLTQPVRILERIEQFRPDAIVLDHEMPGIQGLELARVLRQDARYMTIPILFVSASQSVSDHLEQYAMVGNEVFRKPLDNQRFLKALHDHLVQAQRVSARVNLVSKRKERQGLQNHDYFLTELAASLACFDVSPDSRPRFLIQVGIDREEFLRAQHGARALARLTACMEQHFASQLGVKDSGCALGGGSFLFQVNVPMSEAPAICLERFLQRLNSPQWSLGKPATPVTVSMGVLPLTDALNEDKALLEVERACGEAMLAEGPKVVWCQPPERADHSKPDTRIRELLDARSFTLHYQPIVNMDSGDTLFEALVRLLDENDAIYLPDQFLPLLNQDGAEAFHELDRWVMEHALGGLSKLAGKAAASHSVVIKFASSLADVEKMLPFLSSGMRNAGIKGERRVYAALSSRTVIKEVARTRQLLSVLQEMDCGLILEHLDSSTTSIDLLKELQSVDFVKLAPKYGASAEQTPELEDFLRQLAGIFGSSLPIVATRVEDATALSWFWERGVRYFQGYFIQAPEVAMDFEI